MSSSIEQELYNIFTFYTLHGNPLDPEHLRATQFVKLGRDCQIVGNTPVTEADMNVAYTAEVKRRHRKGIQRMNYNDFLTALMKLSTKIYTDAIAVDDAFQRLLMENILPLASRRCPDAVDVFLDDENVSRLFGYYADAMEQIFQFYASQGEIKAKAKVGPGRSPRKGMNTMKDALGYQEFLKFAADFNLSSSVILSTLEIGDIYLSSVRATGGDHGVRKLTFSQFKEALVRCALVAYSKISDASVIDKIRGLFLYMWRSVNKSVPKAFDARRSMSTYAGDLMSGAMLFNKRFTAQWAADGYRDYLSPEAATAETGADVLSRLLLRGSGEGGLTASGAAASPPSARGKGTRGGRGSARGAKPGSASRASAGAGAGEESGIGGFGGTGGGGSGAGDVDYGTAPRGRVGAGAYSDPYGSPTSGTQDKYYSPPAAAGY